MYHGIYHHLQWDPQAMRLRRVTEDWLYAEPFWHELERRGFRVATVDVPMTLPSRLSWGMEIINWGSHDELGPFRTQPGSLKAEVRRRFGRTRWGRRFRSASQQRNSKLFAAISSRGAAQGELTRWVLERGHGTSF